MNPDLSVEDLAIKARKPYTITKQRERWTEEEHTKFLEALKLYGRAWQRIEEHIGTKTAVQIRSHAQKFFTKLEKEATVNGVGNARDIEIPPPRPKRKPNNPYPRKTCIAPALQLGLKDGNASDATSTLLQENMATFENDPEKFNGHGNNRSNKECSEKYTCFDGPCASPASADNGSFASEAPLTSCTFRQFNLVMDDSSNQDESAAASLVTADPVGNDAELSDEKQLFHENALKSSSSMAAANGELQQPGSCCQTSITDEKSSQDYPRHVPVHILAGSLGTSAQHFPTDMPFMQSMLNQGAGLHGGQNFSMNPVASATESHSNAPRPSIYPFFNCHHFFTPMQNSDDYQAFLQMQSSFSSLIMSSLSQNAAVYAAASFASTLWPWFNTGAPVDPAINLSGFSQSPPMSSTSNIETIAAATVAAATAWWTANGLLPVCQDPGFMCSPGSASAAEIFCCQSGNIDGETKDNRHEPAIENHQPDMEFTEDQNSNARTSSSSDSEASEAGKANGGLSATASPEVENGVVLHDSNVSKNKKQLDRSSCGSNTTSGSDAEPDTTDKLAKGKEENPITKNEDDKAPDAAPQIADLFSRRSRSSSSVAESWKEVSEEGRLAFQALFSREVLPQSFSTSHELKNKARKQSSQPEEGGELLLKHGEKLEMGKSSLINGNKGEGLFCQGLGQDKLKTCRTGFKPYKRCSMEAKETRISSNHQEEEKDPKRLRLQTQVNDGSIL